MKSVLLKLLVAVVSVFLPIEKTLGAILGLIIVDLLTGLWAAKKQHVTWSSAGLSRTIAKFLIYESCVLLAFIVDKYLPVPFVQLSQLVSGYIGLTELVSIMENINLISGTNLLNNLITKLSSRNNQS